VTVALFARTAMRRGLVAGMLFALALSGLGCSPGNTTASSGYARVNPQALGMVAELEMPNLVFNQQGEIVSGSLKVKSLKVGDTDVQVVSGEVPISAREGIAMIETKDYGQIKIVVKTDGNDEIWLTPSQKADFAKLNGQ
jgi:hypothetical protein